MRRLGTFFMLSLVLAGCSDSTGVNNVSITGRWSYSVSNLSGGGVVCTIAGETFQLTQLGNTFSGTATGGTLSCNGGAPSALASDVVANGTVSGNNVTFDIGTSDFHNSGKQSGASITGTTTARLNPGTGPVVLTGNFTAVQQ